ncbi:MAG: peptidoglycan DD-metalloendopeptidase family protein [Romboutsia sp.]
MKKIISLITVWSLLMSTTAIYGENKKDNLDNKLEKNRTEQITIDKKIQALDTRIAEIEANINATNEKINNLNIEMENTKVEISKLEESIKINEESLGKRLKVINSNYSMGYIKVILSSSSLSDFFNNIYIVKQVVNQDKEMLKQLDENKTEVEYKEKEIENKKVEQEDLKITLEKDNEMVLGDKTELDRLKEELLKEEEDLEKDIEKFLAEQEALKQQQNNQNNSNSYGVISNGSWPVLGYNRISSGYGNRKHPILNRQEFHTGIDIPAPSGTLTVAVDNGTIIYSGVKGSYGNTIMIQHDDGKVSLYAHNSVLIAKVGQRVQKGQTVAKIGSTGMSTGPHLHFEIRINGKHVNPVNYL